MNQPAPQTAAERAPRTYDLVKPHYIILLANKIGNQAAGDAIGYSPSSIGQLVTDEFVRKSAEMADQLVWERDHCPKDSLQVCCITCTQNALGTIEMIVNATGGTIVKL